MILLGILASSVFGSGSVSQYILDLYGNAASAFSLRRLSQTYTGSAIRVRRSSDNAEQDIGFNSAGSLDEASLSSFVGSGNYFLYTQEFDNAYWAKQRTTVTANQTTAPDGSNTADLIVETTGNNTHLIQTISNTTLLESGSNYTLSVYLKKGPGATAPDIMQLILDTTYFTSSLYVNYNINTGTVVNSAGVVTASIEPAANGFYRCILTAQCTTYLAGSLVMPFLAFTNNSSSLGRLPSYTGATTRNVYAWGVQLNESSSAQTYASASATQVGSGYVTTWYDQTGNARNAANVTGSAPIIVNYGGIKRSGTRPTIFFNNATGGNLLSTGYTVSQPNTTIVVAQNKSPNTLARNIFVGLTPGAAQGNQRLVVQATTTYIGFQGNNANNTFSTTAIGTILRSYFMTFNGASSQLYTNNTSIIGPISVGNNALASASIGSNLAATNTTLQGGISELIFYGSNQTSNQLGIESNVNSYYTIY
jgi:hypothetical protein